MQRKKMMGLEENSIKSRFYFRTLFKMEFKGCIKTVSALSVGYIQSHNFEKACSNIYLSFNIKVHCISTECNFIRLPPSIFYYSTMAFQKLFLLYFLETNKTYRVGSNINIQCWLLIPDSSLEL